MCVRFVSSFVCVCSVFEVLGERGVVNLKAIVSFFKLLDRGCCFYYCQCCFSRVVSSVQNVEGEVDCRIFIVIAESEHRTAQRRHWLINYS